MKKTLRELIKYQDEPLLSSSHFDQYVLRKKIKFKGFKVLLVGEGGDEVLGGYLRLAITKLCDINFRDKIKKRNF